MTADALVIWLEINVDGLARDLLSGRPADKFRVTLPSGGFAWLLCDFDEKP